MVSLYEPAQNLDFGIVLRSTQNAFVDFGSLCDLITKVILISVILLFMLALYFIYREDHSKSDIRYMNTLILLRRLLMGNARLHINTGIMMKIT